MIAVLSDSHFYNGFAGGSYDSNNINSRLLDIEKVHLDFIRICADKGVKYVFHGGDLYHRRNPTQEVIHYSLSWIELAIEYDMYIIRVPGNHDFNYIQHSMAFLDRPALISDKVKYVSDMKIMEVGDIPILALPFDKPERVDAKEVESYISDLPEEGIVFGHAQPSKCVPGVEEEFNERDPVVIDSGFLDDCKAEMLLGHVHRKQNHILGSCVNLSYADTQDKYGWIGEAGHKGEFIKLEQPVFHTISIDVSEDNYLDKLEKFVSKEPKSGMVRLFIENADETFSLDVPQVSEVLGSDFKVTQHQVRRLEKRVSMQVMEDVSLKHSLVKHQEDNGYDKNKRAKTELEILAEASGEVT